MFSAALDEVRPRHGELQIIQPIVREPEEGGLLSNFWWEWMMSLSTLALPSKCGTAILPLVMESPEGIAPYI
jgi:hypothetical protein